MATARCETDVGVCVGPSLGLARAQLHAALLGEVPGPGLVALARLLEEDPGDVMCLPYEEEDALRELRSFLGLRLRVPALAGARPLPASPWRDGLSGRRWARADGTRLAARSLGTVPGDGSCRDLDAAATVVLGSREPLASGPAGSCERWGDRTLAFGEARGAPLAFFVRARTREALEAARLVARAASRSASAEPAGSSLERRFPDLERANRAVARGEPMGPLPWLLPSRGPLRRALRWVRAGAVERARELEVAYDADGLLAASFFRWAPFLRVEPSGESSREPEGQRALRYAALRDALRVRCPGTELGPAAAGYDDCQGAEDEAAVHLSCCSHGSGIDGLHDCDEVSVARDECARVRRTDFFHENLEVTSRIREEGDTALPLPPFITRARFPRRARLFYFAGAPRHLGTLPRLSGQCPPGDVGPLYVQAGGVQYATPLRVPAGRAPAEDGYDALYTGHTFFPWLRTERWVILATNPHRYGGQWLAVRDRRSGAQRILLNGLAGAYRGNLAFHGFADDLLAVSLVADERADFEAAAVLFVLDLRSGRGALVGEPLGSFYDDQGEGLVGALQREVPGGGFEVEARLLLTHAGFRYDSPCGDIDLSLATLRHAVNTGAADAAAAL